jgi:hypothetical protein
LRGANDESLDFAGDDGRSSPIDPSQPSSIGELARGIDDAPHSAGRRQGEWRGEIDHEIGDFLDRRGR